MTSVADIEKAVSRLGRDDLISLQTWLRDLIETRMGPERQGKAARWLLPLADAERASLISHARECSRRLHDDPADRRLIADVIEMQAENADALEL